MRSRTEVSAEAPSPAMSICTTCSSSCDARRHGSLVEVCFCRTPLEESARIGKKYFEFVSIKDATPVEIAGTLNAASRGRVAIVIARKRRRKSYKSQGSLF